jgi:hypothetical protein
MTVVGEWCDRHRWLFPGWPPMGSLHRPLPDPPGRDLFRHVRAIIGRGSLLWSPGYRQDVPSRGSWAHARQMAHHPSATPRRYRPGPDLVGPRGNRTREPERLSVLRGGAQQRESFLHGDRLLETLNGASS